MTMTHQDQGGIIPIGIWLDLRNPPAWRRPWAEHYGRTLERIEEAERVGIRSVWVAEHHLFEDGYLPQPLTFAAAIAARTKEMRIGTGIVQAPLRKAIDIAEQAAIVDILSNGRLELGLGAGYAAVEFEAYGVDHASRHRLLRENTREIMRLWDEGIVTPPPVQARPPLWIGALGPQLARFAGTVGAGLLSVNEALLEPYREGLTAGGHDLASTRCSGNGGFILADDPERAWSQIAPHVKWEVESYGRAASRGGGGLADRFPSEVDPQTLRERAGVPYKPRLDVVTPAEAIERLVPWAATRPLWDITFYGALAGMPDDLADRHIELLGKHVVGAVSRQDTPAPVA
jgi:alkanesulfonate monooxygenase SsuD/methylene tetrahydromethanopterin reductase-like flavin-dependent oxidoreductase (luciferase family)